jgi:hypothetical protein
MVKTLTVLIGNSDNKLSQSEWSYFCKELQRIVSDYGQIHFFGFSNPDSPFQNACIVAVISERWDSEVENLLEKLKVKYNQDSIAIVWGDTQFL